MRFPGKDIQIIPRGAPGSGCERMGAGTARVLSMGEFPMVGDMVELLSPPGAGKIYVIGPEDDLLRWGHTDLIFTTAAGRKASKKNSSSRVQATCTGFPVNLARRAASTA